MSKQSRQFKVPDELANLYDFANTLDLRHFTHHGMQHLSGDELKGPRDLGAWMSERRLTKADAKITPAMFDTAIQLRASLRAYLAGDVDARRTDRDILRSLNTATRLFPLVAQAGDDGAMRLAPVRNDALAGLSEIVAELHGASTSGTLDRLKMCAADECRRVFFDRSKPGTRRWCVSTLCGNRIKTRTYRARHQALA
jgi:predicted RNA-binding Zn ribbon-like protein